MCSDYNIAQHGIHIVLIKISDRSMHISPNYKPNCLRNYKGETDKRKSKSHNKALGRDRILKVALSTKTKIRVDLFMETVEGMLPSVWRISRPMLIPKGNKTPNEPRSYHLQLVHIPSE